MNLTELQIEIKEVEKHLSSIRSEIEKLKPNKEEEKIDFDYITELARKHPITGLKIKSASEILKADFIKGLAYLLLSGERDIYEGLLYITRLAIGIDLSISSQEIYIDGLSFEKKELYNICNNIGEYKYSFLIESFIIANLCEAYATSKLPIIAEFAEILECDKEDVYVISNIAKSKLIGNFYVLNNIAPPSQNKYSKKFDDYLSKTWLQYKRKECAKLCVDEKTTQTPAAVPYNNTMLGFWSAFATAATSKASTPLCTVKDIKTGGTVVKKGDTLLTYTSDNDIVKKIVSEFDGILYLIKGSEIKDGTKYTYLYVYVVSYFDNYEDFEKWFRNKNK